MSKEKVLGYLKHLQTEIANLEECDGPTKEHLSNLTSEIEHLLDNPDDHSKRVAVVQQLKTRIEQFETEHAGLTSVLEQLMTTLSNMGI
jgi:predicted nuclease with TOPRIM domain